MGALPTASAVMRRQASARYDGYAASSARIQLSDGTAATGAPFCTVMRSSSGISSASASAAGGLPHSPGSIVGGSGYGHTAAIAASAHASRSRASPSSSA